MFGEGRTQQGNNPKTTDFEIVELQMALFLNALARNMGLV